MGRMSHVMLAHGSRIHHRAYEWSRDVHPYDGRGWGTVIGSFPKADGHVEYLVTPDADLRPTPHDTVPCYWPSYYVDAMAPPQGMAA